MLALGACDYPVSRRYFKWMHSVLQSEDAVTGVRHIRLYYTLRQFVLTCRPELMGFYYYWFLSEEWHTSA